MSVWERSTLQTSRRRRVFQIECFFHLGVFPWLHPLDDLLLRAIMTNLKHCSTVSSLLLCLTPRTLSWFSKLQPLDLVFSPPHTKPVLASLSLSCGPCSSSSHWHSVLDMNWYLFPCPVAAAEDTRLLSPLSTHASWEDGLEGGDMCMQKTFNTSLAWIWEN